MGRNFEEIARVVTALQTVDSHPGHACPANWTPGQAVIVGAPVTTEGAEVRHPHDPPPLSVCMAHARSAVGIGV